MNAAKITISIDRELLGKLDRLVQANIFPSRSHAIQTAVDEKLAYLKRTRLATECAKLNPSEEQSIADIGLGSATKNWPPY